MGRAFEFRKARKMKRWAKMSKAFTRIGKDIVIAVKEGGGDPDTNTRLRQVMQNAKSVNMPKENILRAIKKASEKETANYEEISLEGYGAYGIAVFIDCATNNNNRTVADIRSYFNKCDGALGTNGSLEYIFDRKGVFTIENNINIDLENLEMELIDGGLEEFEIETEEDISTMALVPSSADTLHSSDSVGKAKPVNVIETPDPMVCPLINQSIDSVRESPSGSEL